MYECARRLPRHRRFHLRNRVIIREGFVQDFAIDLESVAVSEGKSEAIRREIERAIIEERLKPGDMLPTVRALADDLSINKNTVAAAYRQLRQSGLISAEGRKGSAVARHALLAASRDVDAGFIQTMAVRDGNPDPSFLPNEGEIRDALSRISVAHHLYGEQRNDAGFTEWAHAQLVEDRIDASNGIFVSAGALDAIERALIAVRLRPGDLVAVENPGYMCVHGLVRTMQLEPTSLDIDENGVTPASLRKAIKAGAKAVIVTSRSHNPSGALTSRARAVELRKLIGDGGDILFIDDDHTNLLRLAGYNPWHMGARRWLTVRSVSKALGPDFRIAYSTGDAQTMHQLEQRQGLGMGWVSNLLQRLVRELLLTVSVQRKIAAAGRAYCERHHLLTTALKKRGFDVRTGAGLNVWIPISNEHEITPRLFEAGWLVRPGSDFCFGEASGIRVTAARMSASTILGFSDALARVHKEVSMTFIA